MVLYSLYLIHFKGSYALDTEVLRKMSSELWNLISKCFHSFSFRPKFICWKMLYTQGLFFFVFLKIQSEKKTRFMTFDDERFSIERTESEKELVFIKWSTIQVKFFNVLIMWCHFFLLSFNYEDVQKQTRKFLILKSSFLLLLGCCRSRLMREC